MIMDMYTNIHGHFSAKNQNLTKSYDNGHNFTKSYDSEHPHKYSWPFQWKKSEFNKII